MSKLRSFGDPKHQSATLTENKELIEVDLTFDISDFEY